MSDQLPGLLYLERFRNGGTRTYSSHSEFTAADERYRPDADHPQFDLAAFSLPLDQVNIYTADPPPELAEKYLHSGRPLFCVHPQLMLLCPDDPYIRSVLAESENCQGIPVLPSSSTRTVYVQEPGFPHALKVHFPFKISRYTRKMRDEVIEQAVNVSRDLAAGTALMDEKFAFLREVIGITHKNLDPASARGENWGYLVRDMIPYPQLKSTRPLIPAFALYGADYFHPQTPLLLFDLLDPGDPLGYMLENIMLPIIRHWVGCFAQFGFLLEPHAQNVLLEINPDRSVGRIVHRDLSVGIDMRRRRDIGLSSDHLNAYNRTEESAFHSITYDRFIGGHFFNRLVQTVQSKYPNISKEAFTAPCRDEFARYLPDYAAYFPETVWYFSEERDQFNKPFFEDTGVLPEWRP